MHLVVGLALLLVGAVSQAAVEVPSAAPDFTLRQSSGTPLRLAEQRGRVVLINFWASWCGPCRQEMPHLNRLHEAYRSAGLVLLGVNVDQDPAKAADATARWPVRIPVLMDSEQAVVRRYDLGSMPATVLIDRDGRVRHLHRGYRDGFERTYERQIRELIKE